MGSIRSVQAFLFLAVVASTASATTYYSEGNWGGVIMSGVPTVTDSTVTFGETFQINERSTLHDWTFWLDQGGYAGNLRFEVAGWDGLHAVGPVLYQTTLLVDGSDNIYLTASNIELQMDAGTYVAILTTAGVDDRVGLVDVRITMGLGNPLSGGMVFANTKSIDPVQAGASLSWSKGEDIGKHGAHLWYSTNITSLVPEPGGISLALCGLGAVGGLVGWRRVGGSKL